MKIEEAIKLLQRDFDDPGSVAIEDLNQAQELGIEALKFRQACKKRGNRFATFPLPGETKE